METSNQEVQVSGLKVGLTSGGEGGIRGLEGSPAARGGERELRHNDLAQAPEPRIQVQTPVYSL